MKFVSALMLLTFSYTTFAANKPIYQVVYHLSEKGKIIKSSSVIIEEGQAGEVKSDSGAESESLAVTVKPSSTKFLSVDYRYKNVKAGKSIELAKTAVALTPGSSETNDFKDSSGNDFQLKITVTKK